MHRYIQAGAGVALIVLTLAACTPPHAHHHASAALKTIAALECPDTQGDLTRKSQSQDGKTCVYTTDKGAEVDLQLVALDGQDPKTALAPLEARLKAELPAASGATPAAGDGADHDKVDIDLPGIHIHANGKDDANVDVGGVPGKVVVNGDGRHSTVDLGAGGVSVHAHDKGAEINISESGSGVRLSYILASDNPGPSGFKVVGYEARGPSGGPLAVASVKSKSDDADDLRDDARDLLHLNVGG
jgi:hypothetical protein